MATSQNGWPALDAASSLLYTWTIPARTGTVKIRLRNGAAGFVLCHFLLWFAETIEPLAGKLLDDWGWAWRPIRGQSAGLSNHASGTAADMNATQHPLGIRGTFRYHPLLFLGVTVATAKRKLRRQQTAEQMMRARLHFYQGAIRLGLDYENRPDEMHSELVQDLPYVEKVARRLMKTPRGRRLLAANPTQRAVILS